MSAVIEPGAKVRLPHWEDGHYITVVAVDGDEFWARMSTPHRGTWAIDDRWERYVEPPTVTGVWNLYDGGASPRHVSRAAASDLARPDREAVLTRYSDGSWTVEDVR